jgi:hypothetical protein
MTDLERVAIWNRFREHLEGVMRGEVGGLGEKGSRAITCRYTGGFMPHYAVRIIQGVYYGSTIQYVFSEGICTAVRNKVWDYCSKYGVHTTGNTDWDAWASETLWVITWKGDNWASASLWEAYQGAKGKEGWIC